jgi:hypothetical protein
VSSVPAAEAPEVEMGMPAKDERPAEVNVSRSSKPLGPFGSTRTRVGDSAETRMSPLITDAAVAPLTKENSMTMVVAISAARGVLLFACTHTYGR